MMYTEKELVGIAKRENNKKRNYLVVNKLQAKHVPVKPELSLAMFGELADQVVKKYRGQRVLLVGFAETATAIGSAVAARMKAKYIQTTREMIENVEFLYFSESHSHATEQKLVKNDLDSLAETLDRIIFIEDEVTTGNTILGIIDVLEREYTKSFRYSVASLLNGMNEESQRIYSERNIDLLYLVKTEHDHYTSIANEFVCDGTCFDADISVPETEYTTIGFLGGMNPRRCVEAAELEEKCFELYAELQKKIEFSGAENVLVLGTEEFMYPAVIVGRKLEREGLNVKTHATTRSPIEVSGSEDYPLHKRWKLVSLYDDSRTTYIYDLKKYDRVLIITDAEEKRKKGIYSLVNALHQCGNEKITVVRWCN